MRNLLYFALLLSFNLAHAGENIVTLQSSGRAEAGSHDNIFSVCLKNQDIIRGLQFKIEDDPNYLVFQPNSESTTDRFSGLTLAMNELDGAINIVLIAMDTIQSIQPDSSIIFQFCCSVSPEAPPGPLNINIKGVIVTDNKWNRLDVVAQSSTYLIDSNAGIKIDTQTPAHYQLRQNYPNPFNPTTTIEFSLPHTGLVNLDIFDVLGQHIRNLVNFSVETGTHQVCWDGLDKRGMQVPSGTYFYRMTAGDFVDFKELTLIR
jgi:hypothetical protein